MLSGSSMARHECPRPFLPFAVGDLIVSRQKLWIDIDMKCVMGASDAGFIGSHFYETIEPTTACLYLGFGIDAFHHIYIPDLGAYRVLQGVLSYFSTVPEIFGNQHD